MLTVDGASQRASAEKVRRNALWRRFSRNSASAKANAWPPPSVLVVFDNQSGGDG